MVWKEQRILLDGHNRYRFCTKHNITYRTVEVSLPDMGAAKVWMINNQLGRRNLTPGEESFLRGERYRLERQKEGGDRKSLPQKEEVIKGETRQRLADQYKVSKSTIERDAAYADDINAIATAIGAHPIEVVAKTKGKLGRKETRVVATLAKEHPQMAAKVMETIAEAEMPKAAKTAAQQAIEDIQVHGDIQRATLQRTQEERARPDSANRRVEQSIQRVLVDALQAEAQSIFRRYTREGVEELT